MGLRSNSRGFITEIVFMAHLLLIIERVIHNLERQSYSEVI